mgnify:CR=1 FL=1
MVKTITNSLFLIFLFWLQEGLFVGLSIYFPLIASVVALLHLYRLPHRWFYTLFIGAFIEIYSSGLSGTILGYVAIGLFCQILFSIISHTSDRFYVVVIGGFAVLLGEIISRLSVNLISSNLWTVNFEAQQLTLSHVLFLLISSFVLLFFAKKVIKNNRNYA